MADLTREQVIEGLDRIAVWLEIGRGGNARWAIDDARVIRAALALLRAQPAEETCTGPHSSAFDCPVHDPRRRQQPDARAVLQRVKEQVKALPCAEIHQQFTKAVWRAAVIAILDAALAETLDAGHAGGKR